MSAEQHPPAGDRETSANSGQGGPGQPTFSVAVDYVEVDAGVTDAQGHPVRELRKEDFEVIEDGRRQQVETLSFVDQPLVPNLQPSTAAADSAGADVQTNLAPFEGRIYVLLLDDLHTASARTQIVRMAAREFVERTLHPGDLAAVVHVSAPKGASQDFTSDHRLLLASIDRFVGRKIRSGALNEIDEYNRSTLFGRAPVKGDDPDASARANNADVVFTMIGRLARQVSTIRTRRKVLLWFSEGVDVEMPQRTGTEPWAGQRGAASAEQARARDRALEAMSIATRSDLIVYGIDPRGLRGADLELAQVGSIASDPTLGPGTATLHQETLRDQTTLRTVSEYTGGFAVVNTSQFGTAFDRIFEENSSYYMLGYYPTNRRRDGKFRKIDVRVNRPGVNVRARRGYLAPSDKDQTLGRNSIAGAPAQLQDALTRPIPYSGLGMAVQAAVFRGNGGLASVLVTIQYAASTFKRTVPGPADQLGLSVVAIDSGGTIRGSDHRTIGLDVSPRTRQALQTLGFRTFSRLELPAGRYQLRVASVLGNQGDVGSVRHDLEVPDFSKEIPNMSSVVVTSRLAALIPTAGKDERLQEFLPAPPTTLRDFGKDDTLAFCAETYANPAKAGSPMPLQAIVEDDHGHVVGPVHDMEALPSPGESAGTSVYRSSIPLTNLRPGAYVLRVGTRAAAGATPATRQLAFRVWPPTESQSGDSPADPIVPVAAGVVSGVRDLETVVARTSSEWLALWSRLPLKRPAPTVTFDSTMVVAVFLGARPTAGYGVHIVGTRQEGDTLVVEFTEQSPPPTADNPPVETTPYVVAGVRRHDGPLRFEKVSR